MILCRLLQEISSSLLHKNETFQSGTPQFKIFLCDSDLRCNTSKPMKFHVEMKK